MTKIPKCFPEPPKKSQIDIQHIKAINDIAASLQRMPKEDHKNFDTRTYAFEFPITFLDQEGTRSIYDVTYVKIRETYRFHEDAIKIGMLIAADVNGTRSRTVEYTDRLNAHVHGVIILPRSLSPNNARYQEQLINAWKDKLSEIHGVPQSRQIKPCELPHESKDIWIKPYDTSRKRIEACVSYGEKADRNYNHMFGESVAAAVYPYDKKLKHRGVRLDIDNPDVLDLVFNLHLFPEKVLTEPHLDNLSPWQRHYRELYEDIKDASKREMLKQRFLSTVLSRMDDGHAI